MPISPSLTRTTQILLGLNNGLQLRLRLLVRPLAIRERNYITMQHTDPAIHWRRLLWVLFLGTLLAGGCQSLTNLSYSPRSLGLPPQQEERFNE